MKKITIIVILLMALSCNKENLKETTEPTTNFYESQKLLSIPEINKYIANELKQNRDVIWAKAPATVLWSAAVHGGEILSVGYGEKGESFSIQKSPRLKNIKENIYNILQSKEGLNKSSTTTSEDEILNIIDIKVTKLETIKALQDADQIRYLDPIGYGFYLAQDNAQQKSAGCSKSTDNINNADYTVISPNSQVPWNYNIHKISQAWNYSTGAGITVGLIDTGLSANQHLLGNGFNDGVSNGRTVQKFGTYIDSIWPWSNNVDGPNDKCGHGTQMASVIASPRNNDFMPVGVAYNCNLIAYRATKDVVLDDYHERKGVSNALKALGNKNNVKIISMSIGYPWSIGTIKDAVKYAHSKGKLIFAAGGTSNTYTNWFGVIFPANMPETIAVTGIKDNGYNKCDICHDGAEIDFTIVMQRANDLERTIPTLGFNTGTRTYVSGSSIATATTAGIAALVWARNPSMTRAQVLTRLKKAAEFYPNRNSKYGYGNIDALKAVL